MARIEEIAKGIIISMVSLLFFYFFWDNIVLTIMDFMSTFSIVGFTDTTSISILKTLAWINFVLVFLFTCPIYFVYTIFIASGNSVKTSPVDLLRAIGTFLIGTPVALILYTIVGGLVSSMSQATQSILSASELATASQFSWIVALIMLAILNALPIYFIIKGYGQLSGEYEQ